MDQLPSSSRWLGFFALALLAPVASAAQALKYTIKKIGPVPGHDGSFGLAINGAGQLAGTSGTIAAFRWSEGVLDVLPALPGGMITRAEGIAEDGSVLGSSTTAAGRDRATRWRRIDGHFVASDLGVGPGDIQSLAFAMDANLIVGLSDNGIDWKPAAWLGAPSDPGAFKLEMLPLLPGDFGGIASDVNASGAVVGHCANNATAHPARWNRTVGGWKVTDLGALAPGLQSEALAINTNGACVGYSISPATLMQHAVLWNGGGICDLGALHDGWRAIANGVNDFGDVVGTSGPFEFTTAWVRLASEGVLLDLNAYLPPASPWSLVRAEDINDQGQITGTGAIGGFTHSFLMTPISTFLSSPFPGVSGQENRCIVTHVTPGGAVRFAMGFGGGETSILDCASVNFDIANAVDLGQAIADVNGTARFGFFAPALVAGQVVLFQALDTATCRVTNVTVIRS